MKLSEVVSRIRFFTNKPDDLSGKSVQPLFSNKSIIQQLGFALDRYASYTKSIEKIYSTSTTASENVILAPDDVLRSEGYRYVIVYNNGIIYPLMNVSQNLVYNNFPVSGIAGIGKWFLAWEDYLYMFPENSTTPLTGGFLYDVSPIDTTITLDASTYNLPTRNGRITIPSSGEKIIYRNRTGAILTDCIRQAEGTDLSETLVAGNDTWKENNCHIFYSALHWKAVVSSDDRIDDVYANREMDIPDEHIEVLCKYCAYNLLSKIDVTKASIYKVDYDVWLEDAKFDILKGRSAITKTDDVRDPFNSETLISPYYAL